MEYILIFIVSFVVLAFIAYKIMRMQQLRLFKQQQTELLKSVTQIDRGNWSERLLVLELLNNNIPSTTIFHDLYIKTQSGKFSQIDLAIATKVGIIVFEVKDYSGWIFGSGNQAYWTQVLAYGKEKYRFYNPIMQNKKHIENLKKSLSQFNNIPFFSIIVFYGDCNLKDINFIPNNTYIVRYNRVLEVIDLILNSNSPAPYTDKYEILRVLKEAVQNGESSDNQNQHIENIKDMLGKDRIFD